MESSDAHHDTWEELTKSIEHFAHALEDGLEELGIREKAQHLQIDHICVRLKSTSEVDALKARLVEHGTMISEVEVNGRIISMIQLNAPMQVGPWQVPAIEIPYPKEGHAYEDGWEHVEFVLPEAENSPMGVENAFFKTFPDLSKQELEQQNGFTIDEPKAEGDQLPNPTISIKANNGVGLKFHARPIQEIVGFKS